MIKKPANTFSDRYKSPFGGFANWGQRNPSKLLTRTIHPPSQEPSDSSPIADWLVAAMDDSSVSICFWTLCLNGSDEVWEAALPLFETRASAIFDGDGSLCFSQFSKKSSEAFEQGAPRAIERFAALCAMPPFGDWTLGKAGRIAGGDPAANRGKGPLSFQLYMACLELGLAHACNLLGTHALAGFSLWAERQKTSPHLSLGRPECSIPLARSGALCSPAGEDEIPKALFGLSHPLLDAHGREHLWADALREGPELCAALEKIMEAPRFERDFVKWLTPADAHDNIAAQTQDAQAVILAKKRGYIDEKTFGKAIGAAKFAKLPTMAALLEQSIFEQTRQAQTAKKPPRI